MDRKVRKGDDNMSICGINAEFCQYTLNGSEGCGDGSVKTGPGGGAVRKKG